MKKTNNNILFVTLGLFFLLDYSWALANNDLLPAPCVNGLTLTRKQHNADLESWETCRFQRMDLIKYMRGGFDMDGDSAISFEECNYIRNYYFNKAELVFGESCETVFQRCDCDGDGYITYEDYRDSNFSCLRACRDAERLWYFVGSRMVDPTKAFSGVQEADKTIDKSVLDV